MQLNLFDNNSNNKLLYDLFQAYYDARRNKRNTINPVFEPKFINDSYSCRTGKGTSYGIKRLERFIRSCTQNHTKDNIYLNDFDHYIKYKPGIKYYGRYVDDFVIVHQDKEYLKSIFPLLSEYLQKVKKFSLLPKNLN